MRPTHMRRTTWWFRLSVLVVLVGLAAACADDDGTVETGDDAGSDDAGSADAGGDADGAPRADEAGLVIELHTFGGFSPAGADARTPPRVTIYDDGTVITGGAVVAIYPGPAVMPLLRGELAEGELADLVAEADDAGLVGDAIDAGSPPVADAGTTRITVVVDGTAHVHEVEALGLAEGGPGLTEDQREARAAAATFVQAVDDAAAEASSGGDSYVPERYRVEPLPDAVAPQPVEGTDADVRDWPLAEVELPEPGECLPVGGEDADALREALGEANEATRWRDAGGTESAIAARPVLPHEPDCP